MLRVYHTRALSRLGRHVVEHALDRVLHVAPLIELSTACPPSKGRRLSGRSREPHNDAQLEEQRVTHRRDHAQVLWMPEPKPSRREVGSSRKPHPDGVWMRRLDEEARRCRTARHLVVAKRPAVPTPRSRGSVQDHHALVSLIGREDPHHDPRMLQHVLAQRRVVREPTSILRTSHEGSASEFRRRRLARRCERASRDAQLRAARRL